MTAYERRKRALDILLATLGLAMAAPLWAIVVVAIRLDSSGPALFRQRRVGKGGKEFTLLKFRTMRWGTPDLPTDVMQRQATDPRTRVGRFLRRTSLDELPQLLQILQGEMSLVGPRPALPSQTALNERRRVAGVDRLVPGITGWAQINGRDELDDEAKVSFDREYLARRSLWFDLWILLRTIAPVLSGKGNQ